MCESDISRKNSTSNILTIQNYDTVFSADSVEWCPHDPLKKYFVCANYQLNEGESNTSTRFGRILLFSLEENNLKLHQTIDTSAVLDQKWCHNKINDSSLLGVVNAKKTLEIYKFNLKISKLELITNIKITDNETETLLLSLDWSSGKFETNEPFIVVSDSKGCIHIFQFKTDHLSLIHSWSAHGYEAWICAFYYWDSKIIFSGGDDSKLLKFDTRIGFKPIATIKHHTAGVTCLHSNSEKEFILASGSYDCNVFLWDIRNMKCPLGSMQMPGTLWRLKWNPHDHKHLLAACMLDGVHILNAEHHDKPTIVANYYEHTNISYGADWCHLSESEIRSYGNYTNLIATCSFYDHLLSVAKVKL